MPGANGGLVFVRQAKTVLNNIRGTGTAEAEESKKKK